MHFLPRPPGQHPNSRPVWVLEVGPEYSDQEGWPNVLLPGDTFPSISAFARHINAPVGLIHRKLADAWVRLKPQEEDWPVVRYKGVTFCEAE